MRDAKRELPIDARCTWGDTSAALFAHLTGGLTSASVAAVRGEVKSRLAEALDGMDSMDREVLAMRHFEHLTNTADLEREYLQEVLDLFQTRASTELNRFIRKITAWGAIGVAGTLIAGIYGMNFAHMPELDWQLGYPMALGMIVVVGVVLYVLFRRHGWL